MEAKNNQGTILCEETIRKNLVRGLVSLVETLDFASLVDAYNELSGEDFEIIIET